jgi:hypothetical protein
LQALAGVIEEQRYFLCLFSARTTGKDLTHSNRPVLFYKLIFDARVFDSLEYNLTAKVVLTPAAPAGLYRENATKLDELGW